MMDDFSGNIQAMLQDAEAVTDRRDTRAVIGMGLMFIGGIVMFFIVLPFIGAGVYVAGKESR